jgi:hypothetical protein
MEEKQTFTSTDTFGVWGLVLGVALIVGSIFSNAMTDQRHGQAMAKAEVLGHQILSGGFKSLTSSLEEDSRQPASSAGATMTAEGRVGTDPWGQQYVFRVWSDARGRRVAILLSVGPNGRRDTEDSIFVQDNSGVLPSLRAQGDDLLKLVRE